MRDKDAIGANALRIELRPEALRPGLLRQTRPSRQFRGIGRVYFQGLSNQVSCRSISDHTRLGKLFIPSTNISNLILKEPACSNT